MLPLILRDDNDVGHKFQRTYFCSCASCLFLSALAVPGQLPSFKSLKAIEVLRRGITFTPAGQPKLSRRCVQCNSHEVEGNKMKAVILKEFGGVENLELADWPVPAEPEKGEVRIRVAAATINPVDFKTRKGLLGGDLPIILGFDLSGVVETVGPDVERLSVGDDVYAFVDPQGPASNGSYAEMLTLPAAFVAKKPQNFTFAQAAALPMVGLTAYQCIADKAKLKAGEAVFVAGGSGAVGSVAVQLAGYYGASPIITTAGSETSAKYLQEELGVQQEHIIDYKGSSLEELKNLVLRANGGTPVRAAFDFVGGDMKRLCCEVVDFDGDVVTIVEEPEDFRLYLLSGQRSPMLARSASFHFELLLARARFGPREKWEIFARELDIITQLAESGYIKPHRIKLLDDFSERSARQGHTQLEGRHTDGKLVLPVDL